MSELIPMEQNNRNALFDDIRAADQILKSAPKKVAAVERGSRHHADGRVDHYERVEFER